MATTVRSRAARTDRYYGRFVALGYVEWDDDETPAIPIGASNRAFPLRRRVRANGVRLLQQVVRTESTCELSSSASHSIRMATTVRSRAARTLGERRVVMWEYAPDVERDMFQFGRLDGASSRNDHVIRGHLHRDARVGKTGPTSRYAFRVLCDRDGGSAPRIFAAGFDSRCRVRVGQRAPRWAAASSEWRCDKSDDDDEKQLNQQRWDAMTTFGIRIWSRVARAWFEVSVNGAMHALRPSYSSTSAAPQLVGKPVVQSLVTNELVSGTIVDSCGVLLMWEGAEYERAVRSGWEGRVGGGGGDDGAGGHNGGAAGGKARLEARRVQCPVCDPQLPRGTRTVTFRANPPLTHTVRRLCYFDSLLPTTYYVRTTVGIRS